MPDPTTTLGHGDRRRRVGSLFSGYGGLDLALAEVFDGETARFSEFSPAPARVFPHHWPGVPNLGDITTIDGNTVEPVDVICGGFPCRIRLSTRSAPYTGPMSTADWHLDRGSHSPSMATRIQ